MPKGDAPGGVGDGRRSGQALDQGPCDPGVDRGDQADPQRGEPGREQRDRDPRARMDPQRMGHPVEHVAVGEDVGAADLDLPSLRLLEVRGPTEVRDHVVDGDRLGRRREPGGRDHRRQALDEVAERPVGLASRADDHRRPEVGQRGALLAEDLRRLAPGFAGASSAAGLRARPGRRPGRPPPASPSPRSSVPPRAPAPRSRPRRPVPCHGPGSRRPPPPPRRPGANRRPGRPPRRARRRDRRVPPPARGSRTSARTCQPSSARALASLPPMKPVAPVTRAVRAPAVIPLRAYPLLH